MDTINDNLNTQSLAKTLSQLDNDKLLDVFNNCDRSTMFNIIKSSDQIVTKYSVDFYVIINIKYGGFGFRKKILDFIVKYRPDYNYYWNIIRHDPILLIVYWMLGDVIADSYAKFEVECLKIKPYYQYIIDEYDGMEKWHLETLDTPMLAIPERPPTLFKDIKEFAELNGYEISTDLDRYPKTGPYRIFD